MPTIYCPECGGKLSFASKRPSSCSCGYRFAKIEAPTIAALKPSAKPPAKSPKSEKRLEALKKRRSRNVEEVEEDEGDEGDDFDLDLGDFPKKLAASISVKRPDSYNLGRFIDSHKPKEGK